MENQAANEPEQNVAPGEPCSLLRRSVIMLYDSVVMLALLMLATLIALLAGFGEMTALRDPGYTLYLLLVCFLYLAWFWHRGGMTIGMKAWRVRIEDSQGNSPGWRQVTVRFLASLVSATAFGLGFFWSIFDDRKRTWHDMLSGTRLVKY